MKKLLVLFASLLLVVTGCASNPEQDNGGDTGTATQRTFVVGNTDFAGEFLSGWGNSSYDNNIRMLVDGNEGFFTPNKDNELVLAHYLEDYTNEKVDNPNYDPEYQAKVDALLAEAKPFEDEITVLNEALAVEQAKLNDEAAEGEEAETAVFSDEDQAKVDAANAEIARITNEIELLADTAAAQYEEWTFTVKEGIKFSNGTDFTANDIAFTYYFYSDPSFIAAKGSASSQPNFLVGFEEYYNSCVAGACDKSLLGMEVVDDYTIKFTVANPTYTVKTEFAYYMYSEAQMAPEGVIDGNYIANNFMSSPVGVGPYQITEWNPGQNVKLTVNEYYTGNIYGTMPTITDIVVQMVPSETDIDMLLQGEVDLLQGMIEPAKIDAAKADSNIAYNNYDRHGFGHITWHTDFGATAYPEMRLAIAYAFDKETFVDFMTGDYGKSIAAPFSPHFWMVDEEWLDENIDPLTYDPAKARQVLEDAGWTLNADGIYEKDGVTAEIRIATGGSPWPDYLNNTLANSVEESGIKFTVDTISFAVLLDHYYGLQPASDRLYNGFALATSYTPEFDGYANYHSDFINEFGEQSSTNQSRWDNETNDALLEAMRYATPGTEEGDAAYQEAYREWVKLTNQENPLLPIYANDYHDLYNANLVNFETGPLWEWPYAIVEATWAE